MSLAAAENRKKYMTDSLQFVSSYVFSIGKAKSLGTIIEGRREQKGFWLQRVKINFHKSPGELKSFFKNSQTLKIG